MKANGGSIKLLALFTWYVSLFLFVLVCCCLYYENLFILYFNYKTFSNCTSLHSSASTHNI